MLSSSTSIKDVSRLISITNLWLLPPLTALNNILYAILAYDALSREPLYTENDQGCLVNDEYTRHPQATQFILP